MLVANRGALRRARAVLSTSILGGLLLVLVGVAVGCDSAEPDLRPPDFKLPIFGTAGADSLQLSSTLGDVVVLNFFNPDCAACNEETPGFVVVYDQYQDQGVQFIGVAIQAESEERIELYIERHGVPYPILIDTQGVGVNGYGVRQTPTTYFLDAEANLYGPYGPLTEEQVADLVEALLNPSAEE